MNRKEAIELWKEILNEGPDDEEAKALRLVIEAAESHLLEEEIILSFLKKMRECGKENLCRDCPAWEGTEFGYCGIRKIKQLKNDQLRAFIEKVEGEEIKQGMGYKDQKGGETNGHTKRIP